MRRINDGALTQLPFGGHLDQLLGHVANAVLQLGLAALPARAAKPVKHCALVIRAIARQKLDILDRQEQLAAVILDLEAVMRRARGLDRLQAQIAPDPVVDMHDEVIQRQRCRLDDEIRRAPLLALSSNQTVAEDVLLGHDGEIGCLKACLEAQNNHRNRGRMELLNLGPRRGHRDRRDAMVGQHPAHAIGRARCPAGNHHTLVLADQPLDGGRDTVEHVLRGRDALGGKVAPLHAARIGMARQLDRLEGRDLLRLPPAEKVAPFAFGQIEEPGTERLVGRGHALQRAARRIACRDARLMIIGNERKARRDGLVHLVVQRHAGAGGVVEHRLQPLVEQRQPMLHARMLALRAHRLVERVFLEHGAERRHIARAEPLHGSPVDRHLVEGRENKPRHLADRGLAFRLEAPDRFNHVAKEIEPDRHRRTGRINIHDAAPHGKVAGLDHGSHAREAIACKEGQQVVEPQRAALGKPQVSIRDGPARRHALQARADGGNDDNRSRDPARERRERGHAFGHDLGLGRDAVIGQAIPPGKRQHRKCRVEEPDGLRERRQARLVAGNVEVDRAGLAGPLRDHQRIKSLGGAG